MPAMKYVDVREPGRPGTSAVWICKECGERGQPEFSRQLAKKAARNHVCPDWDEQ